jgi:hypothetical protein
MCKEATSFTLVFLILLASPVHAQTVGEGIVWARLVIYAGMGAILFYIGYILFTSSSERAVEEKKGKIVSLLFIITLGVFALTGGIDFLGSIVGVDYLYTTSADFLDDQMADTTATFAKVITVYEVMSVVSSLEVSVLVVKTNLGTILEPLRTITQKILWQSWSFVTIMSLHKLILEFGHRYVMSTLFPLGLFFFVLPGLRKAGAFLVSIALTLWLFFPLTIVVVMIPLTDMVTNDPADFYDVQTTPGSVFDSIRSGLSTDPVDTLANLDDTLTLSFLRFGVEGTVNLVFEWWAPKAIMWYFVPIINMIFFIILVINLTDILGGESKVLGRMSKFMMPVR